MNTDYGKRPGMKRWMLIFCLVSACALGNPPVTKAKRSFAKRAGCATLVAAVVTVSGLVGWFSYGEWAASDPDSRQTSDFEQEAAESRVDTVVLGDSLSCGDMCYSSGFNTIVNTRMRTQTGWAINVREKNDALTPLFDRLAEKYPARVTVAAWAGAYLDVASPLDRSTANTLGKIANFSDQVTRVEKMEEKPNLVLIWIGHNNMDWAYDIENVEGLDADEYYDSIPDRMAEGMETELTRLRETLKKEGKRVSVVVYGLVDFEKAFEARRQADALRNEDPKLYPYFETPYTNFPSVKPEHQKKTAELGRRVNAALKRKLETLQARWGSDGELWRYSDAIYDAPLGEARMLHATDAFHLSPEGHNTVANAVEKSLAPSLEFLRVPPRP
ncbi:MAG: SGNH/GDSL hydrolase family protein [Bdellovibrionota bacterium]